MSFCCPLAACRGPALCGAARRARPPQSIQKPQVNLNHSNKYFLLLQILIILEDYETIHTKRHSIPEGFRYVVSLFGACQKV